MAKFKNNRPGVLGLNFKGESSARTVGPNEVFEAEKDAIPEHYFTQGWIVEAKDADATAEKKDGNAPNPQADAKGLNPQYEGPQPTQGSGTSVLKSETDQSAKESGAYDNPHAPPQHHDDKKKK